jgi:SulP family sulfate permease
VLASLFVYLSRTTRPQLTPVAPNPATAQRRFAALAATNAAECPPLAMLRVDGSLFFGAVEHVHDALAARRAAEPQRPHVLLIGSGINFIDVAGGELLAREATLAREADGALYLCRLKPSVREVLARGGLLDLIGPDRVFETKDEAIRTIYPQLDSERCRVCTARIFAECQTVLPDGTRRAEP